MQMELSILNIERKVLGYKSLEINEQTTFSSLRDFLKGNCFKRYSFNHFVKELANGQVEVLIKMEGIEESILYPSQQILEYNNSDEIKAAIASQLDDLFFRCCQKKDHFEFYNKWFGNEGKHFDNARVLKEFLMLKENSLDELREFHQKYFKFNDIIKEKYGSDLPQLLDELMYLDAQYQPKELQFYLDEFASGIIPGKYVDDTKARLKLLDQKYYKESKTIEDYERYLILFKEPLYRDRAEEFIRSSQSNSSLDLSGNNSTAPPELNSDKTLSAIETQQALNLLVDGHLEKALEAIFEELEKSSNLTEDLLEFRNKIRLLQFRLEDRRRDFRGNLISYSDLSIEKTRIAESFLSLL